MVKIEERATRGRVSTRGSRRGAHHGRDAAGSLPCTGGAGTKGADAAASACAAQRASSAQLNLYGSRATGAGRGSWGTTHFPGRFAFRVQYVFFFSSCWQSQEENPPSWLWPLASWCYVQAPQPEEPQPETAAIEAEPAVESPKAQGQGMCAAKGLSLKSLKGNKSFRDMAGRGAGGPRVRVGLGHRQGAHGGHRRFWAEREGREEQAHHCHGRGKDELEEKGAEENGVRSWQIGTRRRSREESEVFVSGTEGYRGALQGAKGGAGWEGRTTVMFGLGLPRGKTKKRSSARCVISRAACGGRDRQHRDPMGTESPGMELKRHLRRSDHPLAC